MLVARHRHFRLESGRHGNLWLELDGLFERPARLAPWRAAVGWQRIGSTPRAAR